MGAVWALCGLEKLSSKASSILSLPNRFLMQPCPGTESEALKAKRAPGAHVILLIQHSQYIYFAIALSGCNPAWVGHAQTKSLPQTIQIFTLLLLLQATYGWCYRLANRQTDGLFCLHPLLKSFLPLKNHLSSFEVVLPFFSFLIDQMSFETSGLFSLLCCGSK